MKKSVSKLKKQIKSELKEKGFLKITREIDKHPELLNIKSGDVFRVGKTDIRII